MACGPKHRTPDAPADSASSSSAAARDGVGIDGQVSNWAIEGDDLVYLDVTTPLLRDETRWQRVDLDLFIASLPWAVRQPVRRFLLGEILSHYHAPRPVLLDAVGNLHKEKLEIAIPALLDAGSAVVDPPIGADEARKYYRWDASWGGAAATAARRPLVAASGAAAAIPVPVAR
jgi:hypothetical protein